MPWCPVCKNEYKEGITHCVDCHVDLVEALTEERKPVYFGEKEKLEKINAFFQENGVESGTILLDESENELELSVLESDVKKALKILGIFLTEEKKASEQSGEDLKKEEKKEESVKVYVNKKEKAMEYKTSAYTLFLVGILGIVCLICIGLGILPIHLTATTKIMMYVVLGGMFVLFLVFGVLSVKSYKRLLSESDTEEDTIRKVQDYLEKSLTREVMESYLGGEQEEKINSEAMYFERTEIIEKEIKQNFPNLEESLIAKLTDDYYVKLYEE